MRHNERGNVLFYILIAVALLGALSFAVSQNSVGNIEKVSEDRARLYAVDILEYSSIIAASTAQLKLRGCSETEISFYNTVVTGYTNASSPTDYSCHIFHANGGGIQYRIPDSTWLDATQSAQSDYGELFFPSTWCVYNVGTNSTTLCNDNGDEEMMLIILYLDQEVCTQLNKLINVENPSGTPPKNVQNSWTSYTTKYTGSFGGVQAIGGTTYTEIDGKTTGCFEETSAPLAGTYHFYKVLVAR